MKNPTTNNYKWIFASFLFIGLIILSGCSTTGSYQPIPPVKVITETVEVEIYQPPLPPEIQLSDVEWKVITTTPCKPATAKYTIPNSGGRWYYTSERFAYEDELSESGFRVVQRDADGNRIELPQLLDDNGNGIEVCGNLQQKIAEIETMLDGDFVILAVTPVGYEKLAANLQEIKRYINQQKDIIYYYRESTAPKGVEGWLEENAERQQNNLDVEEANNESQYQEQPESTGFNLRSLIPGLPKSDN